MSLGDAVKKIKQDVLDETARRSAMSAMMMKDKRLDPQSLRDDIDTLAAEVAELRKAIKDLRKG